MPARVNHRRTRSALRVTPDEAEFVEQAQAFTSRVGPRAVLLLVGSRAAGLADSWSDLDMWVVGDKTGLKPSERRRYERHTELFVDRGDYEAHYTFYDRDDLKAILHGCPDEKMWIVLTAKVLFGDRRVAAELKRLCRRYPRRAVEPKLRWHYGRFYQSVNPLNTAARGMPETAFLIAGMAIEHLCKVCCLAERKPFPYAKWLIPVSRRTVLGRKVAPLVSEAIFGIDELLHPPEGKHYRELVPLKNLRQTRDIVRKTLKRLGWRGRWVNVPEAAIAEAMHERSVSAQGRIP